MIALRWWQFVAWFRNHVGNRKAGMQNVTVSRTSLGSVTLASGLFLCGSFPLTAFAASPTPPRSSASAPGTAPSQAQAAARAGVAAREKVVGIGGFFFRSKDPKALAKWYEVHLGITLTPETYGGAVWQQGAGPTVFQPFPANTDYFGAPDKQWMIDFRVSNLDAMVRQLRASHIEVTADPTVYPNGRFARLSDPEGNAIELWEPTRPKSAPQPPIHSGKSP